MIKITFVKIIQVSLMFYVSFISRQYLSVFTNHDNNFPVFILICFSFRSYYSTRTWELPRCQLCRHQWKPSLLFWQPLVTAVTTKLTPWQRPGWNIRFISFFYYKYIALRNYHYNLERFGTTCDVITHSCANFNGGLSKPPSKLGHGWVITFHNVCGFNYLYMP